MPRRHIEHHYSNRIGWLRAAVLGADDGLVSTASLVVGVAAANNSQHEMLLAAVAGLVAGAMSMAAGEYVSVSSQADTEQADIAREQQELASNWQGEQQELMDIYIKRGLDKALAEVVAAQLMANDALKAHEKDELGLTDVQTARPLQAAMTSAITFASGAAVPTLLVAFMPISWLLPTVVLSTVVFLAILGGIAAYTGGSNIYQGALRVAFWGGLALGVTAGVGKLFGTTIS